MKGKKSFVMYCDQEEIFTQLDDATAGKLIKHIYAYVNDKNPQTDDVILKIAFTPFRQQLKRDLLKWNDIRVKRSEAGKASAKARSVKQSEHVLTSVESVEQTLTNSTVNVNVNDNVTVNDNVNDNDYNIVLDANKLTYKKLIEMKSWHERLWLTFNFTSKEHLLTTLNNFLRKELSGGTIKTVVQLQDHFINWLPKENCGNIRQLTNNEIKARKNDKN